MKIVDGFVLKNINKVYPNGVQAVFDFNLEIKDKEFVVFVGPSGCGKSTTLRMIAGLETITYGEFFIDGELMNDVAPKDRNIAMVFQSYALYPHMTVYNNMAFAINMTNQSRKPANVDYTFATIDTRTSRVIETFNASLIAGSPVTLLPIATPSSLVLPSSIVVGKETPRTSMESKYSMW